MLDVAPDLTPREIGVAEIALDRARKIAPAVGPAPLLWLAAVLRRHKSFSHEGRLASMLAAINPARSILYLRPVAAALHMSPREVREALRTLEAGGYIRTATTIRTEAVEIALLAQNTATAAVSAPLAGNSPDQPPEARKARRRPTGRRAASGA